MDTDSLSEQDNGTEQLNRLKEFRLFRGLSQTLLAEKTNCSVRTISRIESFYPASDLMKARIARVLNANVEDVFPAAAREAEASIASVTVPRNHPSWRDSLLRRPFFTSGPEIKENLVRPNFLINGKPVHAQATLLERLHVQWGLPVVCGEFGSGKTILTALISEQLNPKEFSSLILPADSLSRNASLVNGIHQFLVNAYGEERIAEFGKSTKPTLLVIDGLEDLAFDWTAARMKDELEELIRYFFAVNMLSTKVFPLFTANDLFASAYLSDNPNLDLFWLQPFTTEQENGDLPLLSKWWTRHLKHHLKLEWDSFMDTITSSDYGGYTECPLANSFVAQYIGSDNHKSFMLTHDHHRAFQELLYRRPWSLTPARKLNQNDFQLLAEVLAVCDSQKGGITQDAFLMCCEEFELSHWARGLGLQEYGRFVRVLAIFPIVARRNRYYFRLSGFKDWLIAKFAYRSLKLTKDSAVSGEKADEMVASNGFKLTTEQSFLFRAVVQESLPKIRLVASQDAPPLPKRNTTGSSAISIV